MSIYRLSNSPFWQFDFQWRGCRFHGSTKCRTKREAEKVEAAEREKAKATVAQLAAAKTSLRLDDIAGRYWAEHGQNLAGAANTWSLLGLVVDYFGKDKLITEITDDDVARMVAWRRGHRSKSQSETLISPFTVNHTTTTLRKLFTRAKLWGVRFSHEPTWSKHLLKVPAERVRELSEDEEARLFAALRPDYAPLVEFALATGWRLDECLLKWDEIGPHQIIKTGKGGGRITRSITSDLRALLGPLRGHHPVFVFTYICERGEHGRVKGERYPITYGGVQTYWRRLRKASGIVGLRFHDLRHDFATKLLRRERNLKLVQKAMHHKLIKTTMRYAHVLDEEVAAALERGAKSQTRSQRRLKVV